MRTALQMAVSVRKEGHEVFQVLKEIPGSPCEEHVQAAVPLSPWRYSGAEIHLQLL